MYLFQPSLLVVGLLATSLTALPVNVNTYSSLAKKWFDFSPAGYTPSDEMPTTGAKFAKKWFDFSPAGYTPSDEMPADSMSLAKKWFDFSPAGYTPSDEMPTVEIA